MRRQHRLLAVVGLSAAVGFAASLVARGALAQSPAALRAAAHEPPGRGGGRPAASWARDDYVDWLLFRAQLERVAFFDRVMRFEETNPQVYVGECSNAIFSLIKKEYDTPRARARAAAARLRAMPAMLAQGERNLTRPVRLYARLAVDAARAIDGLFVGSMMKPLDRALPPAERNELVRARDPALAAVHAFADRLEARLPR